jgi:hypothetical protein
MVVEHIAGLPVEEVLLAALAAAAPLIALVGWEISARFKRLKARLLRRDKSPQTEDPGAGDARLRDYEFGGSESGQGVDG